MPIKKSIQAAGKKLTPKQVAHIQHTVKSFPALSLRELGHTLCEHFHWLTPKGKPQIQLCLTILEAMAKQALIELPAKIESKQRGRQKKVEWTNQSDRPAPITGALAHFMPLRLEVVRDKNDIALWNELVDRYHYLGYKRPLGMHLRYFILDRDARPLGGLLFSFATWSLPCRDQWLGWTSQAREARLKRVLNNNRFLIFPWVDIKNLASKTLSMVTQQIAEDWQTHYGYRPVLLETFIDPTQFKGTCYRAANWQGIGQTAASPQKPAKDVYVYPLTSAYRATLVHGERPSCPANRVRPSPHPRIDSDPLVTLWQQVLGIVIRVGDEFDQQWQQRRRLLNSLLLVLFIFRLVFSNNKQGYHTTIAELWAQCRTMNIALPQVKPVAASAFCAARAKLDERIFAQLNTEIVQAYLAPQTHFDWHGHRLFAVDGTKINLPRPLTKRGYPTPCESSYYPQGLVSCLYQLKAKIPTDFILVSHADERKAACTHLCALHPGDLVIYDRGYFSYAMLSQHLSRAVHAVFRIKKNASPIIDQFIHSSQTDLVIELIASKKTQAHIRLAYPQILIKPLKLRLIKYQLADTVYCLGTTLLESQDYPADVFPDLYHARWGIEELYKISKTFIDVEDFHSQTERGVKQELYAHFVLVTLTRLFANQIEDEFKQTPGKENLHPFQVNFKHCLATIAKNLEALFLDQAIRVKQTLDTICSTIRTARQRTRPNRSYPRRSRKPVRKWTPDKDKTTAQPATV